MPLVKAFSSLKTLIPLIAQGPEQAFVVCFSFLRKARSKAKFSKEKQSLTGTFRQSRKSICDFLCQTDFRWLSVVDRKLKRLGKY